VKKKFRIIFMGTPEFSVPSLMALHENGHDVRMVVSQPDRPKGRGRKITPAPVKLAALSYGDNVIQPASIKTADFADRIEQIKPDLLVVIAFGHILPENLLKLPRLGAVNIHASLLPKYRGPAPIHWAIINGEKETGVCSMLMDKGQDTGDILLSAIEPIRPDDTAGTLYDRLSHKSAHVLIDTLDAFAADKIRPTPQDHSLATDAPRLSKNDGRIDWSKAAESLEPFIRGVTPWPGAFTFYGDIRLKIFKARPIRPEIAKPPGTVVKGFPDELRVATGRGALCIEEIQGPSGKRLLIKDFLRGYHLPPGAVLE
jgi:methionyl-tRNA formyltransferase